MRRFSIVMPTRNRAHLLKSALQTALAQTFDDYEILVSDNNSTDDTRRVAHELGDGRVRYIRTGADLSMRDSWEFALMQAEGEYVTVLPDDDAISSRLLERMDSVVTQRGAELVQSTGGTYFDGSWPEREQRHTLTVPTFTRRVVELDSEGTLQGLFSFRGDRFPTPANSVCRRTLLERILEKRGHLFYGYCPDHSGACVVLAEVKSYLFLDEVLSVGGATASSTGMVGRRERGEIFVRAMVEHEQNVERVEIPLDVPTQIGYYAKTLVLLQRALAESLGRFEIDWVRYFALCHCELEGHERLGLDVKEEKRELARVLAAQSAAVRAAVHEAITEEQRGRVTQAAVIDCASEGISDILGCVRYIDSLPMTIRGIAKSGVLSVFRGRRGLRIARKIGRIGELCGLGGRRRGWGQ